MSCLKLFRPENSESGNCISFADDEPAILSFPLMGRAKKSERLNQMIRETVNRAWLFKSNTNCPSCDHAGVEPVELNDAHHNQNSRPIPGTATLVGFRCRNCHQEWPLQAVGAPSTSLHDSSE